MNFIERQEDTKTYLEYALRDVELLVELDERNFVEVLYLYKDY